MKKFAVAIYSNFSYENNVYIIDSVSETDAMIQAIIKNTPEEERAEDYMQEWIEDLKKYDSKVLKQELMNTDICINIIEIK